MDSAKLNEKAWDEEGKRGNYWTQMVAWDDVEKAKRGEKSIWVTPSHDIPLSWLGESRDKSVLLLASGGGQQTVLLSAMGFSVTSVDISEHQVEEDRKALEKYGLKGEVIKRDVCDLSFLPQSSYDIVISPHSLNFIPDVVSFFAEVSRVIRKDGLFIFGSANPVLYIFDEKKIGKGKLEVKYTIPYSDEKSLGKKKIKKMIKRKDTFEYSHTLSDIIGGVLKAGFVIEDFFTDESLSEVVDSFIHDSFLAIKAKRL